MIWSLIFFCTSSVLCILGAKTIPSSSKRIIDLGHYYLPRLSNHYLSDVLIGLQVLYTICVSPTNLLVQMIQVMTFIQLCRLICFTTTILPPLWNYHDKWRLGGMNGCGREYIFSGHASYAAVTAIYLGYYRLLPFYVVLPYNFFSQLCIVAARNHYTVDVVLAWIIASLTTALRISSPL